MNININIYMILIDIYNNVEKLFLKVLIFLCLKYIYKLILKKNN